MTAQILLANEPREGLETIEAIFENLLGELDLLPLEMDRLYPFAVLVNRSSAIGAIYELAEGVRDAARDELRRRQNAESDAAPTEQPEPQS